MMYLCKIENYNGYGWIISNIKLMFFQASNATDEVVQQRSEAQRSSDWYCVLFFLIQMQSIGLFSTNSTTLPCAI